jgi:hypothetical protein
VLLILESPFTTPMEERDSYYFLHFELDHMRQFAISLDYFKSLDTTQNMEELEKKLLSRDFPCFERHVKPLVPAAFAVVSTHQPAMGPRGGLWSVLLMCNA